MRFITGHIILVGRVVAFLFFLSSSGFTTAFHLCTMEATECCDPSGTTDHKACQDENLPAAGLSVKGVFDCHTNTLGGGLNPVQGLVEKQVRQEHSKPDIVVFAFSCTLDAPGFHSNPLLLPQAATASPPSVEKYVLTAAYLI